MFSNVLELFLQIKPLQVLFLVGLKETRYERGDITPLFHGKCSSYTFQNSTQTCDDV